MRHNPCTRPHGAHLGKDIGMTKPIKRIAINTGGGDAPSFNALIQAVTIPPAKRGSDC